jgi:hypothetical protein
MTQRKIKTEDARLDATYAGLKKLFGMVKSDVRDASTTIDDVLYGENGAGRGMPDEEKNA